MSDMKPNIPAADPTAAPGYDTSPVHVRVIVWLVVGIALSVGGVLTGLWWMESRLAPGGQPPQLQALQVEQPLQPSPGHPTLAWEDLQALRVVQEKQLHSYGPPSRDGSHTRIPIDRAMDLLLQSGELQHSWVAPSTQPYQMETRPSPWIKPSVRNGT